MATTTKKTKEEEVKKKPIVALRLKTMRIPIVGASPLIVHEFDAKSQREMAERARKKGKLTQVENKEFDTPEEQYERTIYYCSDGKTYGFPATAFKACIVTAAYRNFGRPQTITRSSIHIIADDAITNFVKINGVPHMRTDTVRVSNGAAAPRYRACFAQWSAVLTVQFVEGSFTEEEIVALVGTAGWSCGVGEWRPEKSNSGSFGTFAIANE